MENFKYLFMAICQVIEAMVSLGTIGTPSDSTHIKPICARPKWLE